MRRFRLEQRVAAAISPILAPLVAPGTTGKIKELIGWRAFVVEFDGYYAPVNVMPEELVKISKDAPTVAAAQVVRYKSRKKPTA